jgi:hypothetical protein
MASAHITRLQNPTTGGLRSYGWVIGGYTFLRTKGNQRNQQRPSVSARKMKYTTPDDRSRRVQYKLETKLDTPWGVVGGYAAILNGVTLE